MRGRIKRPHAIEKRAGADQGCSCQRSHDGTEEQKDSNGDHSDG